MPLYGGSGGTVYIGGEQGPVGPAGPQGPAGADGLKITSSVININNELIVTYSDASVVNLGVVRGPKGDQGVPGLDGAAGVDGSMGPQGPQGLQGIAGVKGDPGATGPQGDRGLQGNTGPKGNTGSRGPAGIQGDQGVPGVKGDRGLQGLVGPAGSQGPAGIAGTDGKEIVDVSINVDNELIVLMSDSTTFNAGAFGSTEERVGEIIYFSGTVTDPRYLACTGAEYSETQYPDLAATGLTPNETASGVPSAVDLIESVFKGGFQMGDTAFVNDYDDTRLLLSGSGGGKMYLVGKDDLNYKPLFNLVDSVGTAIPCKNGRVIESLSTPTEAFIVYETSSSIGTVIVPRNISPTYTTGDIVAIRDPILVASSAFTDTTGGTALDSQWSTAGFWPFDINGTIYALGKKSATALHLIKSTDQGVTFEVITTITDVDTKAVVTSGDKVCISGANKTAFLTGKPDIDNGVYTTAAFTSPTYTNPKPMDYDDVIGVWCITTGGIHGWDGNYVFHDPISGVSTVSATPVDLGGVTNAKSTVTAVGDAFIVGTSRKDVFVISTTDFAPAAPAITLTSYVAVPLLGHFDSGSNFYYFIATSDSAYTSRLLVTKSQSLTYFLPLVPDSGNAKAYIRATNE